MVVGPDSIDSASPMTAVLPESKSYLLISLYAQIVTYSFLHRSRQPRLGGNYGQATRSDGRGLDSQGLQSSYPEGLIHISEPTRQAEISYAVFCLKKKNKD